MALVSPLLEQLARAEPLLEHYGPARPGFPAISVVQTFGPIEAEYAALRKAGGAGLLDMPQRATLVVGGGDRLAFLNRMLTQELKGVQPYAVRASFWLSRKGRVDADIRVIVMPDRVLLDVDAHAAPGLVQSLGAYVIADDVTIADETERWHRLGLHGGVAMSAIERASVQVAGEPIGALEPGRAALVRVAGHEVIVDRCDTAGTTGLELLVPTPGAMDVYNALLGPRAEAIASDDHHARAHGGVRPIGWAAWNMARIEAGTPVFYLDFGPESLPAETGVLDERVSFTKGCYLGQEVVARMKALGHPKQTLCALIVDAPADSAHPSAPAHEAGPLPDVAQPETGARVWAWPAEGAPHAAEPVGRVTSSTISPMLGQRAVCFAQVKWGRHAPGTRLAVELAGTVTPATATVQPKLRTL